MKLSPQIEICYSQLKSPITHHGNLTLRLLWLNLILQNAIKTEVMYVALSKTNYVAPCRPVLRLPSQALKRANKSRRFKLSLSLSVSLCPNPIMSAGSSSLMWFRKGLRIHDNPALERASKGTNFLYPVFVIDPHYMKPDPNAPSPGSSKAGLNRIRFLLQSLVDLDFNLKKLGSRLLVLKGDPSEVIIRCLKEVILSLFFTF